MDSKTRPKTRNDSKSSTPQEKKKMFQVGPNEDEDVSYGNGDHVAYGNESQEQWDNSSGGKKSDSQVKKNWVEETVKEDDNVVEDFGDEMRGGGKRIVESNDNAEVFDDKLGGAGKEFNDTAEFLNDNGETGIVDEDVDALI
ncbi:hypothetical protein BTUL_0321g00120 [Botrytis tulipae]|uniref:Uncharacterized protein n=1 Tax=Botrytis tulipae TaxID=87230 RepID=A0A4Z1E7E6_9HELO|nr:hypothetical protein BTUL_0321g00120 [Botrytis tulipae]